MLNFVIGTSGVGKTKYLYDIICDKAMVGDDKLMFIVPDQLSFETEKTFLSLLGPKLMGNIKVFGFSRLCDYVFEQTGHRFSTFADEGVRNVVMNLAIEQVVDELDIFSKRARAIDLTELMLNSIKEYKKCSITTDKLYSAADRVEDEALSKKLRETALLYDTYDAIMSKSYIDPLDSLSKVKEILSETRLFDGYTIAIDSYYGFTSQEYGVLSSLLVQCSDMYVALTTDNLDGTNGDLFFVSDRTKRKLSQIARDNHISIAKPVVLTENHRFKSADLSLVDKNIFRIDTCNEETDGTLTVYQAKSIYDECDYVASNINKLVFEQGYCFSDIAVVTRNIEKYTGVLDTVFDKYGISYFMDKPQDIDTKPLIKFVMSCFNIINDGFDKDDILCLLKTGLTDFTVEQIADFENYLFVWDINKKALFDEFTENPRGFADEFKPDDVDKLKALETMRKHIIDNLRRFYFDTKDTTGLGISKALMKLLYALNTQENLKRYCDILEQNKELDLSAEQIRLYNLFVEILDKMVAVIGDYRIDAKRFAQLLHINFLNTDISFIPRFIDQVEVCVADRSIFGDKRAVFVIGALDGEFPHTPVESGVFSDVERQTLSQLDIVMSDSVEQLIPTEKYLAYKALSSASERLFVSFHSFSLSGKPLEPSVIVNTLPQCVSGLYMYSSVDRDITDSLWSDKTAFDYLVSHYDSTSSDVLGLKQYFMQKDEYKSVLETIDRVRLKEPLRIKDTDIAKKLFNPTMNLSASQLDMFYKCRFQYFCSYGLRVRERRQAKIDSLEYGTLMHYIFEKFLSKHKDDDFSLITMDMVEREVQALLDEYFKLHLGSKDKKSKRFVYLYYRVKSIATRIVFRMVNEFMQSSFRPTDFELGIGEDIPSYTLKVDDEITVNIKGSVDRVDIMEENGTKYLRVIDYKTGTKKYNLSDVLYGINLQMFIYMSAISKNSDKHFGDKIVPAGVLYVSAESPAVDLDKTSDTTAFENPDSSMMKGVILNDERVIKGMDKVGNVYIPVSIDGDNIIDKTGSLATLEQFGALFRLVDKYVAQMAVSLCDGDIAAVPTKGLYDACKWCLYKSICGYTDDDQVVDVLKLKPEQVMTEISRQEADNEQSLD